MKKAVGEAEAGKHFVAVTDPGSHMQQVAERDGFRHIFYGDKGIGGRYSVLSNFGLVPAAAAGLDIKQFLLGAMRMVTACSAGTPPAANPGVQLGVLLGVAAKAGRDKVTIVASPGIVDLGAWLEQLLRRAPASRGTASSRSTERRRRRPIVTVTTGCLPTWCWATTSTPRRIPP